MTTFREIYLWINRYTEDAQSQYRGRKSHLTLSTQALLNQTHALVNEHRVSEVWSMVSRLTDLCNCESYSVNERAEIFLECGFIVSGLGSSFDAAEHFDKAASNYICLHNMSIAFWGKGLNLWRMIEEHQNAIVAWRLAMDAFSDCCETTKKEIDTLRVRGKLDSKEAIFKVTAWKKRVAWYDGTYAQMQQALLNKIEQNKAY